MARVGRKSVMETTTINLPRYLCIRCHQDIGQGPETSDTATGEVEDHPRHILCTVRAIYTNWRATHRDIYNFKFAMKMEMLAGRSPLEALLNSLVDRQIVHSLRRDKREALTYLFIVPEIAC